MNSKEEYFSIKDVKLIKTPNTWETKSGGTLTVPLALPIETLTKIFLHYSQKELREVPENIRGLRIYLVNDIPQGKTGGKEFHKIREEIVIVVQGSAKWTCEDITGDTKEFTLKMGQGIWNRPYIFHTYESLEDHTILAVVCNTLFNPDNPKTHDTYKEEEFRALQKSLSL